MCSGESIGYFLFVESANSTSPYSCSPSLGFTSSRLSIFGDIGASFHENWSLPCSAATTVPLCNKHTGAVRALTAPEASSSIDYDRTRSDVYPCSSAQVMKVTTLPPSSVLSRVIVLDLSRPLGAEGREVGEKKPSDSAP